MEAILLDCYKIIIVDILRCVHRTRRCLRTAMPVRSDDDEARVDGFGEPSRWVPGLVGPSSDALSDEWFEHRKVTCGGGNESRRGDASNRDGRRLYPFDHRINCVSSLRLVAHRSRSPVSGSYGSPRGFFLLSVSTGAMQPPPCTLTISTE